MARYSGKLTPIQIIRKLEKTKNIKTQTKIINDAWKSDCEEFFLGVQLSIDPTMKFNISSVPEIQEPDDGIQSEFTFQEFFSLATRLSNNELNGQSSKEEINKAALKANIDEWNLWYRRILLKTLPKYIPMDLIKNCLLQLTKM